MDSKLQIIINDGDIKLICSCKLYLCCTQTVALVRAGSSVPATDQAERQALPTMAVRIKNKARVPEAIHELDAHQQHRFRAGKALRVELHHQLDHAVFRNDISRERVPTPAFVWNQ